MRRKVIRQGHGTLTITLPRQWTRKLGLKPGDEVEIIEKDGGMFIENKLGSKEKSAEFDITGMDIPTIWKYLMAVYREGYTTVKINFSPKMNLENPYKYFSKHSIDSKYKQQTGNVVDALQSFVDRFIGYEVVKQSESSIIVHEMGPPSTTEFNNSMRRIFLLIKQMGDETLQGIKSNKTENINLIHNVDVNLDKFHDYCARILNQTGAPNKKKLHFATLYLLELLGDEYKNISVHLAKDFPGCKFNTIKDFTISTKKMWDLYYELYYKFDTAKIKQISDIDKDVYYHVSKVYSKASPHEREVLHHLRMIGTYINALIELRIEMEF